MMDIASFGQDEAAGQATFEIANLRPDRTGLPFVVFISQKDNYPHDIRVKVSNGPKVTPSQMGTYALRPFRHEGGFQLNGHDEAALKAWVEKNTQVLVEYWDGDIIYTEDAIDRIVSL